MSISKFEFRNCKLAIVMSDYAIRVENLSKLYRIGGPQARYKTLRDTLMDVAAAPIQRLRRLGQPTPPEETIWALKDVSFEVKHGEVLGIIGRNGSGKTTLLKVLSRITEPTEGSAEIHGRVGSLLEVGTGFHPELTGRENIYLNGAILGMRRTEIDRRFDEIVEFAEIAKFLDTPVKRYSSGMYVRLAFAVAAHLEPEILLVDEVLAVGDAIFQKKCLRKMGDVAKEGRTVLFVSHNMPSIQALCQSVLLLQSGMLKMNGDPNTVVSHYLSEGLDVECAEVDLSSHPGRSHSRESALQEAWILDHNGVRSNSIMMGESLSVCFQFRSSRAIANPGFGFVIEDKDGRRILSLNNYTVPTNDNTFRSLDAGMARLHIPNLPLVPGTYFVSVNLVEDDREWVDHVERALAIHVQAADVYGSGKAPSSTYDLVWVPGHITATPMAQQDSAQWSES
jgi:lipopolysaccharide transport system ATP-binding protein